MSIPEAYQSLRKKHPSLPSYADIDRQFRISTLDSEDYLFDGIRKRMGEELSGFHDRLSKLLFPESPTFPEVYESRCLSTDDRRDILELYRKLMLLICELEELDLTQDEKRDAEFIKRITGEWAGMKKQWLGFVRKFKTCWQELNETKEILEYMG